METLADPVEAIKLYRLQKELSQSNNLTEVSDEFHLFEMATNKHFNATMNKEQKLDGVIFSKPRGSAKSVVADITKKMNKKTPHVRPIEEMMYDRMTRKDFSRKPNSFAKVLMSDNYSNFRFSKRAVEVLSPLNTKKIGLGTRAF